MKHLDPPVRFGLTGLGGYAGYVCDRFLAEAQSGRPSATLVAVAEPEPNRFPHRVQQLQAMGIRVFREFAELLAFPLEAVWLPLPIDLHLPFTEQALRAGKAVMCEKPAAGSVDDVDAMIAARDRAGRPVAVGFQDLYQPSVTQLKQRLVAGEFGKPIGARVIGSWPRSERYFTRNDWAGRLSRNGRWVMDSPANNALAHFLHLTLFLLGDRADAAAKPCSVAAELYRANPIENYDTCSMRFTLASDVPVLVAFTHASATTIEPVVVIETERATISFVAGRHIDIRTAAGEERLPLSSNPHKHMLARFGAWVRHGVDAAPGSSLEMARMHVVAVNAASEAAPVFDVAADHVRLVPASDGAPLRTIDGIIPAMRASIAENCLLHETGLASWAQPPRTMLINGYHHFRGPATAPVHANGNGSASGNGNGRAHSSTYVAPPAAPAAARA